MTNVNWQPHDIEWIEQTHQLLLDLARIALSDRPQLPPNFSQRSLTLAQKGQVLLEKATDQEEEWISELRQILLDLARIGLSDQPKLPENMSQRAVSLAQIARKLKEIATESLINSEAETMEAESSNPDVSRYSADSLWYLLQDSLKNQQSQSPNPNAPEWEQLFNLLHVAQSIHQQLGQ